MHCVTSRIQVVSVITGAVRGDHRLFAYSKIRQKRSAMFSFIITKLSKKDVIANNGSDRRDLPIFRGT